jgi:hypothetical protein
MSHTNARSAIQISRMRSGLAIPHEKITLLNAGWYQVQWTSKSLSHLVKGLAARGHTRKRVRAGRIAA